MAAKMLELPEIPVVWVDVGEAEEKRILAADNRTAELGGYDEAVLASLLQGIQDDGGLLGTGYAEDDLTDLIDALTPAGEEMWGDAFGALPDGDKEPFQQMSFTLHDSQAEMVREALAQAKDRESFDGSPNENSNGNALAALAAAYLGGA
jgi:hypothetical protein